MRSQVHSMATGLLKPAIKPTSKLEFRRSAKMELYALIFTGAVNACGALILSPVLPFYAMSHGDATAYDFALITSAYSLCQMVSAPLLGSLSDRCGRRPVLLLGTLLSTALYFMMAEVSNVQGLLVVRAALGFVSGTEPAEIAYISDLTSREERAEWINLQKTIETFGALLGPSVGGYLAPYGFPFLCRVMGVICALNLFLGVVFFTEPHKLRFAINTKPSQLEEALQRDAGSQWKAILGHFTHRTTGPLLVAGFLDSFALAISDGPEAYYLRDAFGFDEFSLGKFFMTCSAATIIVSQLVPAMRQCVMEKAACVIFSVLSAMTMATMFLCQQPWIPYLYGALISSTSTVVEIVSKTVLLSKMVHENERGAIYGMECALLRAGFSLGPALGGLVYDEVHVALPYALSALCFLLSAVAYSSLPPAPRGEPLLAACAIEEATSRVLEHHSNAAPLPGKRSTLAVCGDVARRVFFVDQDLYALFREESGGIGMQRSHSIGVASMAKQVESSETFRPTDIRRGCSTDM